MRSISIFFSPTGGGRRIAAAIQRGIAGDNCDPGDTVCVNNSSADVPALPDYDGNRIPVIITIPVYGGHMPAIARERLDGIRGNGRPAILVAVYGNRAFEHALTDLDTFVRERGFVPVAAAAFVCEHSYSTTCNPIAVGRPDDNDLSDAEEFGHRVRTRLLAGNFSPVDTSMLTDEPPTESAMRNFADFVSRYQRQQSTAPVRYLPVLDRDLCTGCSECLTLCPTGAIGPELDTDPTLCIKCCACVKGCKAGARSFISPFAPVISQNFNTRKAPRYII